MNNIFLTFNGLRLALLFVTSAPAAVKARSAGALVEGIPNTFDANEANNGYFGAFSCHHNKTSSIGSLMVLKPSSSLCRSGIRWHTFACLLSSSNRIFFMAICLPVQAGN